MEALSPEILAAYREHEREMSIRKSRLGCLIGIVLFPIFNVLDHYVYPALQWEFLKLRLICAAGSGLLYPFFGTRLGRKFHSTHALLLVALPSATIAWMIHVTEGVSSSYYAGLNLIMLVLAVVLDWTFIQGVLAVSIVIAFYVLACWGQLAGSLSAKIPPGVFSNNLFFLMSTGVIVIVGTYFHSRLRLSEFVSRYELDRSRRALAAQNQVLEDTLKQLKETELQLVQTEKIVSLGRLSAGIIHEINNPLNYAATGLYALKNQGERLAKEEPKEFQEILRDVEDALSRVKNIVSDLRSFTHPDAEQREGVKLAEVITASVRLLSNEWKDKAQIDQVVPPDLMCRANKNKLTQVFLNLIQNALDALNNRPPSVEPPVIRIAGRREEGKIIISVRDNGEGIDPQNLARIFDPFFTTREVGQGMGMGLSICYRIIHELNGNISVTSERGKFCDFTIELPSDASESMAA